MTRPPALVLSGSAPEVVAGIAGDFALLAGREGAARVWTTAAAAVVLGVSRDEEAEVDAQACVRLGVAVVRRASGGGTVFVGPGTVQYALSIPHAQGGEPPSLTAVRRACNEAVLAALGEAGVRAAIEQDECGDLRLGDRKVGGFAMRRQRDATMLHGTLLLAADLDVVAGVLRHPLREPPWRRGRGHADFLANLGALDRPAFESALGARARRILAAD